MSYFKRVIDNKQSTHKTKRFIFFTLVFCMTALLSAKNLFGVSHISNLFQGPKEYVREKQQPFSSLSVNGVKGVISPAAGTKKVAVILVNFESEGQLTSGACKMTQEDITGFNKTLNYLKDFYAEVSYNKLNLEYTFFYESGSTNLLTGTEAPYELDKTMFYYGLGDESGDGWGLNKLIINSLDKANQSGVVVSSSAFDGVIIAHAGYGNESTSRYGDIWSAFVSISRTSYGFEDGIVIPARELNASPIGVTCHEFAHMLGLPDLYSTNSGSSSVGKWCLMDMGTWINQGSTPAHPSVWCKKYLGWVEPKIIKYSLEINNISPIQDSSNNVYQLNFPDSPQEYLLICYTTKSDYNPAYPGEGILIWQIDEGKMNDRTFKQRLEENGINNYNNKSVDIIPADYSHPRNYPYGGSMDAWPGVKRILENPRSHKGEIVELNIANIFIDKGKASFSITNSNAAGPVSIGEVISYPNPAGSGYYHPRQEQGIMATLVFDFSQISFDKELYIYNIAGEKVLKVENNEMTMNVNASGSSNFIYEYDWDGKNVDGVDVAPGVYFYSIKSDEAHRTGKMVIIR